MKTQIVASRCVSWAQNMPTMRLRPGLRPGPHWGAYSAPQLLWLVKGMGPRDGAPTKGRGRKRRGGGGRGKGIIVATRSQILRLKCEDALLTDLLTSVRRTGETYSTTIGCANFGFDWPLLFKVHEI